MSSDERRRDKSGTAAFLLFYQPAFALDKTESIGAEKWWTRRKELRSRVFSARQCHGTGNAKVTVNGASGTGGNWLRPFDHAAKCRFAQRTGTPGQLEAFPCARTHRRSPMAMVKHI